LPLETATYISDLVTSNPPASDGLNGADDHMRLIKAAIKTTFSSITGQVTATHTDLNNAAGFLAGTVISKVPLGAVGAPSYSFVGDLDTGFWSPGANQISGSVGGVRFMNVAADKTVTLDGALTVAGALNVTGVITGPGMVPIGGMIMWLTDTLPTLGTWCWANGGTLNRTGNGAALYALTGTTYGVGDGVTTFNVINMQEAVPVGKSTMGGAASPGLINSISSGLKAFLGGLFGSDTHTLATANLPPYTPAGTIATVLASAAGFLIRITGGNIYYGGASAGGADPVGTNPPTFTSTWTGTPQGGTSTPINNEQPSRVVNFIIRIG
jgi:microcystin-dependent protein